MLTGHQLIPLAKDNGIMVYLIKLNTEGVRNLMGVTSNARNKGFNFLRMAGMKTMVNDVRPPLKSQHRQCRSSASQGFAGVDLMLG